MRKSRLNRLECKIAVYLRMTHIQSRGTRHFRERIWKSCHPNWEIHNSGLMPLMSFLPWQQPGQFEMIQVHLFTQEHEKRKPCGGFKCEYITTLSIPSKLTCNVICIFNSLRPSDANIYHQLIPSLVQIMPCRLAGDNPLSEPMLEYC